MIRQQAGTGSPGIQHHRQWERSENPTVTKQRVHLRVAVHYIGDQTHPDRLKDKGTLLIRQELDGELD